MALFKKLNTTIEKPTYTIKLAVDYSYDHWGSEHSIITTLSKIDNIFYSDDQDLSSGLISWAMDVSKTNKRIIDGAFYRIPDQNKVIFCVITKAPAFEEAEIGTREMSISFKKRALSFSIVEILEKENKEIAAKKKSLPENWMLDEKLTNSYRKFRTFL